MQGTAPGSVEPIIDAASTVYERLGYELIITSAADGKHMPGSLHYEGKALEHLQLTGNTRRTLS